MKVYVCYYSWDYEGCSQPMRVFVDEKKATDWEMSNNTSVCGAHFEELELEE